MIECRYNPEGKRNDNLGEYGKRLPDNQTWITKAWPKVHRAGVTIALLGGNDAMHFRARVAQSHVRSDLLPSYWSEVLVARAAKKPRFFHVPMVPKGGAAVPKDNAIEEASLAAYADKERFPNVALIHFPSADPKAARKRMEQLAVSRLSTDLVSPALRWLGYLWGAAGAGNPLLEGMGIPGSSYAEEVLGAAGIDATPGLSERVSCPEAIWQGALWWGDYFEASRRDAKASGLPSGLTCVRQPNATAMG